LLFWSSGSFSQTTRLTLEERKVVGLREAVELALGRINRTDPEIARWRVKEEQGRLWPELSLRGRQSYDSSSVFHRSGGGIAGGGAGENTERYNSDFVLSYNLLQFLESLPRIDEARANERVSLFRLISAEAETILRVSETYLTFVSRQETLKAFELLRRDQVDFVRRQEARAAQDLIPAIELLRAQGDLVALDREILSVRSELATAELNLRRVTGLEPEQSIGLVFSPEEIDLRYVKTEGLPGLLALAKEANPRLRAAETAVAAARFGAAATQAQRYPTLTASTNYGSEYERITSQNSRTRSVDKHYGAFLTFNLPLFDGGVRSARVTQANIRVDSQLRELRQTADDIKALIESEYWSVAEREQRRELLEYQLKLVNEELKQSRIRIDAGFAPPAESLFALERATRLTRELAATRADLVIKNMSLALATGRSPFTPSLPSPSQHAEASPNQLSLAPSLAADVASKPSSVDEAAAAQTTAQREANEITPSGAALSSSAASRNEPPQVAAKPLPSPSAAQPIEAASRAETEAARPTVPSESPKPADASISHASEDRARDKVKPTASPRSGVLKRIHVSAGTTATMVSIMMEGKIAQYAAFELDQPVRLVVDLQNVTRMEKSVQKLLAVNSAHLKQVMVVRNPEKLRIVLDLAEDAIAKYRIVERSDGLRIILGEAP
jgi:outer membrane protein TolC